MLSISTYAKSLLLLMVLIAPAKTYAGFILFTDRDEWEAAVTSPLAFEGFNDGQSLSVTYSTGSLTRSSSLISEGARALSVKEGRFLTMTFPHEVFAFGFDLNELNTTNLDYSDSAGHALLDAFQITDIWNASTFFGLISDVALTSFSLEGFGADNTVYGIDALSYTAATSVSEPTSVFLLVLALGVIAVKQRKNWRTISALRIIG